MSHRTRRLVLASEIVGFSMLFGIVSAVGGAMMYYVGSGIDSAEQIGRDVIDRKIARIDESLRVIRIYYPPAESDGAQSVGVEIVNVGRADVSIDGVYYVTSEIVTESSECETITFLASGPDAARCALEHGVISDLRFDPPQAHGNPDALAIMLVTGAGNVITVKDGGR